jgi:CRP/FNR family transcriptional regulator, cyclic AMP receptor protein
MTIQDLEPLLAAHPFFAGIRPAHLKVVVGCAKNAVFKRDEMIHRLGEPANTFYVLRHGKVGMDLYSPGRGAVSVETIEEGEVFGFGCFFPPYRWAVDCRALELVRAVAFDAACLRTKFEADPRLGYELTVRFGVEIYLRLRDVRMQLLDIYGPSNGT